MKRDLIRLTKEDIIKGVDREIEYSTNNLAEIKKGKIDSGKSLALSFYTHNIANAMLCKIIMEKE